MTDLDPVLTKPVGNLVKLLFFISSYALLRPKSDYIVLIHFGEEAGIIELLGFSCLVPTEAVYFKSDLPFQYLLVIGRRIFLFFLANELV